MTDRVMTEKQVKRLAEIRKDGGRLTIGEVYDLVASHCLLQQRVTELENEVKSLRGFKQSVDEAVNMGDGSYRP